MILHETDLKLYDLMGEDHELEASVNPKTKQVSIKINNESGNLVYHDNTHEYAWDSLVYFAKQVLSYDKRIKNELELLGE